MKTDEKLREILAKVYSCDVRSDKQDKDKIINQALSQIHSLYLEKLEEILPKELTQFNSKKGVISWEYKLGYNKCLSEIKSKIKEKLI